MLITFQLRPTASGYSYPDVSQRLSTFVRSQKISPSNDLALYWSECCPNGFVCRIFSPAPTTDLRSQHFRAWNAIYDHCSDCNVLEEILVCITISICYLCETHSNNWRMALQAFGIEFSNSVGILLSVWSIYKCSIWPRTFWKYLVDCTLLYSVKSPVYKIGFWLFAAVRSKEREMKISQKHLPIDIGQIELTRKQKHNILCATLRW